MQLDRVIAVRTDKTVYRTGNKVIKVFNENFSKAEGFKRSVEQRESGGDFSVRTENFMRDG